MKKTIYTAIVTSRGGRDGHVRSSDQVLDVELAVVSGLGRTSAKQLGTNPEQLFAAGYAACFESTIAGVAEAMRIHLIDTSVVGYVKLNKDTDGLDLSVKLEVHLPGLPDETAAQLVAKAHQQCPYSKAVKGNMEVVIETLTR